MTDNERRHLCAGWFGYFYGETSLWQTKGTPARRGRSVPLRVRWMDAVCIRRTKQPARANRAAVSKVSTAQGMLPATPANMRPA